MLSDTVRNFDLAGALLRDGYAVIDNAVDAATCAALAAEYDGLHGSRSFEVSGNVVEEAILIKDGVQEMDLLVHRAPRMTDAARAACPLLTSILDPAQGHLVLPYLQEQLPTVGLCALDQLKIQRAVMPAFGMPQTSCFPMHFDTSSDFETRRTVTVLLYLTDDDGVDGGELDVFPFPGGTRATLAPKRGRLVVFGSFFLYHRTRPLQPVQIPGSKQRVRRVLSMWFASNETNDSVVARSLLPRIIDEPGDALLGLFGDDLTRTRKMIATANMHQNLRFLTKLWLAAEIEASLVDAYGRAEANQEPAKVQALQLAIAKHRMTVVKLRGIIPADVVAAIDAGLLSNQSVSVAPV